MYGVVKAARTDIQTATGAIGDRDLPRASTVLKGVADSMDRELAWLRGHPPQDCYAHAFLLWTDGVRAYAEAIPLLRRELDAGHADPLDGIQSRLDDADRMFESAVTALQGVDCTTDQPESSPHPVAVDGSRAG
jgi:hypothetical protein